MTLHRWASRRVTAGGSAPFGRCGAAHAARFGAAVLLLALGGCRAAAPAPAPAPSGRAYVVLISLDGFRADYLDRYPAPNLRQLARDGVRADALVPVAPSMTFTNHYAMVTGLYPERTGVVANEMYDPTLRARYDDSDTAAVRDARWYAGEPIWVTAERQGVRAATFFWPASEAPIAGVRPSIYRRYDASIPNAERVRTMIEWLRLPPERRPRLVLGYFSDVDAAGGDFGPDDPRTAAAVARVDSAIGHLRAGLAALPIADSVQLLVVSDHGMRRVTSEQTVYLGDFLAPMPGVERVLAGPYAQFFFAGDTARQEAAYRALRRVPHARVFRRAEIPEALHLRGTPRAGDLLLLMDPPWRLAVRRPARPRTGEVFGEHGYINDPEMNGIFLGTGSRLRPRARLGAVRNLDVYPLLARLLGITPAAGIDGRAAGLAPALRRR